MSMQLMCPNLSCRKVLSAPDDARGKLVLCSHCQTTFRVPAVKARAAAPAAPDKADAKTDAKRKAS